MQKLVERIDELEEMERKEKDGEKTNEGETKKRGRGEE